VSEPLQVPLNTMDQLTQAVEEGIRRAERWPAKPLTPEIVEAFKRPNEFSIVTWDARAGKESDEQRVRVEPVLGGYIGLKDNHVRVIVDDILAFRIVGGKAHWWSIAGLAYERYEAAADGEVFTYRQIKFRKMSRSEVEQVVMGKVFRLIMPYEDDDPNGGVW